MFLNQLSIAKRLACVLGLILSLSLLTSLFAVFKLRQMGEVTDAMLAVNLKTERAAADWLRNTTAGVQRAAAIAKSSDASLIEYFAPATAAAISETNELQKYVESQMVTPEQKALNDKISDMRKAYLAAREEVSKLKKAGDTEGAAKAFAERFEPMARTYVAGVQEVATGQRAQLDAAAKRNDELRSQTSMLLVVCGLVSLLLGLVLSWYLSLSITRPLKRAEASAQDIANLDLTGQPQASYSNDETGHLLRAIDQMRTVLQTSLQQVRGVVDNISTASHQIASGNQDLSARTENAASSLQETASSMEELTSTVQHSADAATQASVLANSAAQVAQRGGDVVAQVVSTMDQINNSSKKISDIIGVIDSIAFQTNILALNAAVEAARAGEQGRGFAVVASEVRSLAQRSANAAREIKGLIGASVESVDAGARLVSDAGSTMDEIVASVKRVTDMMGEISAATKEQSHGIGQVNIAVTQLDQMTQQNAALVEESTAAAQSLNDQALRLSEVVGQFRLGYQGDSTLKRLA
ncbi:methyl-accepting chemotaxis protein [Acidovorax sp. 62]|uniref:methyl-accepting chemotaxis protein n=1 Tax=Acidovorax sp. 62 TaxID=2035203 RepID=UPI000C18295B|nr:methyl-accepting chemotaxis protein [Acidovorax sp. 62]PIF89870.1 methyl-accepting chemotaxis protein [Acidovorax sp. 62]